ncbi:MAG: DNA-binding protein, partial [Prevotella sp.]|nr:DNA-binding protein [Prevotella sp.]
TTFSIPPTTAKYFRFEWTPEGTEPGAEDLDAAKWKPVLRLKNIKLGSFPLLDNWEGKAGYVWRIAPDTPIEDIDNDEFLRPTELVYSHIKGTDEVDIQLPQSPQGAWRILRMGHTSTGHTNATAGGAKGLECDKFSHQAVAKQIDSWFGLFMQRPHHEVVKYMHVDSWECGSQNWSPSFAHEFERRRGYDLQPLLPVYAGVPMQGGDEVLRDIRRTINELVNEVFFTTVAQKARQYGVSLSSESVAPTMVSDGMEHYKYVDLPMGEYWLNSPTHDKPNDMLDAISGAHVYGKNIVQAEGFTEVRGVWDETPAMVKPLLDRNFALGMNRLFFHVNTHNPYIDHKPGMTLDGIGLFFQRDQTWFPEAKAFVSYITRCQEYLQQG